MNIMITPVFRILMIVLGFGLFACSSSKFNYQDAYKFSHPNYQSDQSTVASVEEAPFFEPLASTNPDLDPVITTRPVIVLHKTQATNAAVPAKALTPEAMSTLSSKERKAFKQNIRHELKQAIKAQKTLRKEAKNKKSAMNRKVYAGLIIAGAGLIIAILASGSLGALAIIVGVGLIAWGLIEQGSI